MTDKELLEMAAKALGYEWRWGDKKTPCSPYPERLYLLPGIEPWNPLKDDGEAFRLARDCRVQLLESMALVDTDEHYVQIDFDPQATLEEVRRAIVLAAAEVGKAMP